MDLTELKAEIKELANGKYHSVTMIIAEYHTGEVETEYKCYIDGLNFIGSHSTAEEALSKMEEHYAETMKQLGRTMMTVSATSNKEEKK